MQETRVRSLGQEDSLEEGMATHSSILPWKTPWIEEPGGLQSIGLERVEHEWSNLACSCCSVTKWCLTLCDPMDCSTTGSCPPLSPRVCSKSCPLSWWCYLTILSSDMPFSCCLQSFPNQYLFQWVGFLHQVARVLELQLQHQSFQSIFRVDFL